MGELMTKISILEKSHEYSELVKYYEEKLEETKTSYQSSLTEMVKIINKLSNPNNNVLLELLRERWDMEESNKEIWGKSTISREWSKYNEEIWKISNI